MRNVLAVCLTLLFCAGGIHAQIANNTSLVGNVTDPAGHPLSGVRVVALNEDTKVTYTGQTNDSGYYSISFIAVGTYDLTIDVQGFKKETRAGVPVPIDQAVRTDFALQVGSNTVSVVVSASTPPLATDDPTVGETFEAKQVESLPINGHNALEVAATSSNIVIGSKTSYMGVPPGEDFVGAGQREISNSLTLDGVSIVNNLITTAPARPSTDMIQEVQTQNGNYPAQYGMYMGVHINLVSKSGGNTLHGTAYDYIKNTALDAHNFTDKIGAPKTPLHYNQYGFVLGGPVVIPKVYDGRDKTFFMGSYEKLSQAAEASSVGSAITSAMESGDFSAVPVQLFDPYTGAAYPHNQIPANELNTGAALIAKKIEPYLATPNAAGTVNGTLNNVNLAYPSDLYVTQTLDRVDENIGQNVRLFVRYHWQNLSYTSAGIPLSGATYGPTDSRNIAFGYTHVITPKFVNDFRIGRNTLISNALNYWYENNLKNAGTSLGIPGFTADTTNNNPGIPDESISSYNGTGNAAGNAGTNWFQDDRTIDGYDQVSYTFGHHNIMGGAELRKLTLGRAAQNSPRGIFTFNGQLTKCVPALQPAGVTCPSTSGYSAADFVLGLPQNDITPVTQIKGSVGQWRDGFFVLDNWQVSPKLNLNIGLRYELPTVAYSLNGYSRILNPEQTALIPASTATSGATYTATPGFKFTNPNHNDWAPRFGFAYRPSNRVVIRGGYGIYYNPNQLNSFTLATGNYPFAASVTYTTTDDYPAKPNLLLSYANPTPGAGSASPVAGQPHTYVSVFTDNPYLPSAQMSQWNLTWGQELWKDAAMEIQYLGSHSLHLDRSFYDNQPTPGSGTVNSRRPNQLFGQIRQIQNDEFANYEGLTTVFRQRLNHGVSAIASYTWSHDLDISADSNNSGTTMNQYDIRADYGNSNWDIRHRFVGMFNYAFPTLAASNFAVRSVLGGWEANGLINLQTGEPVNIALNFDNANVGVTTQPQRPNWVHTPHINCTTKTYISGNGTSCIDATAYSLPAQYTFGNVARNQIHGPGFDFVNFSLSKNFPIWERVTFQFRSEFFNLFNHPNPALGGVSYSQNNPSSSLGTGFNPANPATYNGSFGTVTGVQTIPGQLTGARVIQLAGKVTF